METESYKATTTTTTTRQEGPGIGLDREFPGTPIGIFMILGSVFGLVLIICGSIIPWNYYGGGYVVFVGILAFCLTGTLFFLYLLRVVPKIPGPFGLIMLVYLAALLVLTIIALIVSAVNGWQFGAAIASAVFCVPVLAFHTALGYFLFVKWRKPNGSLDHAFHRGECGQAYRTEQSTTSATVTTIGGGGGGAAGAGEHRMEAPPAYGNY